MMDDGKYGVKPSDAVKWWAEGHSGVLIERVKQVLGEKYALGGELSVRFDGGSRQLCLSYGHKMSEMEDAGTYDVVESVRGDIEESPYRFMSEGGLNMIAREVLPEKDLNEVLQCC